MQNNIYRIIDANVNRLSEALRVLEDWARYIKDNQKITENLKNIRHETNNKFKEYPNLILSRDSEFDVGKEIENTSARKSIREVLKANFKRAEEATRVLSEYCHLINKEHISFFEKIRYELYSLEKEFLINERILRLKKSFLYLVTNRDSFSSDTDFLKVIEKAINNGVDIIQLREKKESEKNILRLGKEIKKIICGTEVLFIVNDRIDTALALEADGVHLGQDDLSIFEARKIVPDGFIIGLSTHSEEQGKIGVNSGADYLGVGPVFPTPTKPDYKAAGLEYVTWASKNLNNIPWFAIGGIDETNIDKVIYAGANKIAVVRAIMHSNNPAQTVNNLKHMFCENNHEKVS